MDKTTAPDRGFDVLAVTQATPRRRWSDGPNYPVPPASEESWSLAPHWPALAAAMCEQVAQGTAQLAGELDRLTQNGLLSQAQARTMRRAVHAMDASGHALQQVVRLGAGLHHLSPDRVELAGLARQVVRDRQRELLLHGGEVSLSLRRAEVWVDGSIAQALVRAGLEWALGFSPRVRVKVDPGCAGDPARLVIRGALASPAAERTRRDRRLNDNLHWILLRQVAASARLPVSRSSTAATEAAVIEFPATITVGPRRGP